MTAVLEWLNANIGVTRRSEWMLIDQHMIDRFADATFDHQFIHVDPVRAAASYFGGTVAHGFLTLSLLPRLLFPFDDHASAGSVTINYGFERVRFIHPIRSGSYVSAVSTIMVVQEKAPGRYQTSMDVFVEIQGEDKPALNAVWLSQILT